MTVYGLYVFDRHCTCTFYANYDGKEPRPGPSTLPNVYRPPPSSVLNGRGTGSDLHLPPWERNQSGVGTVSASDKGRVEGTLTREESYAAAGLAFDEEAKLVYGIVFSLRNLVKKLAGRDGDSFHSFSTSAYKLHYLHTSTSTHFVLVTSPMLDSLRSTLSRIYTGPFTDFVVRNPTIELDSSLSGKGIDNDAFRAAVARLVVV